MKGDKRKLTRRDAYECILRARKGSAKGELTESYLYGLQDYLREWQTGVKHMLSKLHEQEEHEWVKARKSERKGQ